MRCVAMPPPSYLRHVLSRAFQGTRERSGRQHPHHIALVGDGATQVCFGPGRLRCELRRLSDTILVQTLALEKGLCLVRLQWCGTNVCQTNASADTDARSIDGQLRCYTNDGEVSNLAFQFDVRSCAASSRGGNTDFCQHFIRTERGGKEIGKEFGSWDHTLALEVGSHNFSPQGKESRWMIVGRISMSQVATNGSEVAHQRVANDLSRIAHNRVFRTHEFGMFEVSLTG